MAQIPIQTTPTVALQPGGMTPASAGAQVAPIKDLTGENIYKLGAATQKLGTTVASVADRLQSEFNDAEKKRMSNELADIISNETLAFSKLQGRDAATQSTAFTQNVAEKIEQIASTAQNDQVKQMFMQSAGASFRAFNFNIQKRAVDQQREYSLSEGAAETENFMRTAGENWDSYDQAAGNFALFKGAAIKSANDLADLKGWAADSEQRKQLILATKTGISNTVVNNLVNANRYEDAQKYLTKEYDAGNLSDSTYQQLENMVHVGFVREEGTDMGKAILQKAIAAGVDPDTSEGKAGMPALSEMIKEAKQIADKDMRDYAVKYITDEYNTAVQLHAAEYKAVVEKAQAIAWDVGGSYLDIPMNLMSKLEAKDLATIVQGPPRGDDPDTVIELYDNPQNWVKGKIEKYRSSLSESTYQRFYAAGNKSGGEEKLYEVSIDSEQFNATLARNDMQNLVSPKSKDDKLMVIQLRDTFQKQIDERQKVLKRKLSLDERQSILDKIFLDKVYVSEAWTDPQKPMFSVLPDEYADAYVNVGGKEYKVGSIPVDVRTHIVSKIRDSKSMAVTEQNIMTLWVQAGQPMSLSDIGIK